LFVERDRLTRATDQNRSVGPDVASLAGEHGRIDCRGPRWCAQGADLIHEFRPDQLAVARAGARKAPPRLFAHTGLSAKSLQSLQSTINREAEIQKMVTIHACFHSVTICLLLS